MPFTDFDGTPIDRVPLLYRGGRRFQLERGFRWTDPRDGATFEVPPHDVTRSPAERYNSTDLASVPPILWGLVASYGRQTLPAILHDRLVDAVDQSPAEGRLVRRRRADAAFRVALEEQGVTWLRALTMWAAVSFERYWSYRRLLTVLLAVQVLIGMAAVVAAVVFGVTQHPAWWLVLLAPAVAAAAWGRDAELVIAATYLGLLYLPLVLGALVASGVEYLVAVVVWLARGRRGAPPRPGPTIRTAAASPRGGAPSR